MMTWIGIVFWGMLALGLLALIIRSFLEGSSFDSGILALLFPTGLFGYLAFSAYQRTQHGQIIINPITHKIKSRKREINFDDVETLVANQTRLPLSGVIKVTFIALVTNGNPMILGSISGDLATIKKKGAQIMELLSEKGFSVNFGNTVQTH